MSCKVQMCQRCLSSIGLSNSNSIVKQLYNELKYTHRICAIELETRFDATRAYLEVFKTGKTQVRPVALHWK